MSLAEISERGVKYSLALIHRSQLNCQSKYFETFRIVVNSLPSGDKRSLRMLPFDGSRAVLGFCPVFSLACLVHRECLTPWLFARNIYVPDADLVASAIEVFTLPRRVISNCYFCFRSRAPLECPLRPPAGRCGSRVEAAKAAGRFMPFICPYPASQKSGSRETTPMQRKAGITIAANQLNPISEISHLPFGTEANISADGPRGERARFPSAALSSPSGSIESRT